MGEVSETQTTVTGGGKVSALSRSPKHAVLHTIKCCLLQMRCFSRWVFEALYTNYSFTNETASVNSCLDYLYKKYLAEPHLWGKCPRGPVFFAQTHFSSLTYRCGEIYSNRKYWMQLKTSSNQNINFISHRRFYLSDSRNNSTIPVRVRKCIST